MNDETRTCTQGHAITGDNAMPVRGKKPRCRRCKMKLNRRTAFLRGGGGDRTHYPLERLFRLSEAASDVELATILHCQPDTIQKWRARGGLGWIAADEAACALGLHPAVVWPEWYDYEPISLADAS